MNKISGEIKNKHSLLKQKILVIGTSQAIWAIDNTYRFDKLTYSLFIYSITMLCNQSLVMFMTM